MTIGNHSARNFPWQSAFPFASQLVKNWVRTWPQKLTGCVLPVPINGQYRDGLFAIIGVLQMTVTFSSASE